MHTIANSWDRVQRPGHYLRGHIRTWHTCKRCDKKFQAEGKAVYCGDKCRYQDKIKIGKRVPPQETTHAALLKIEALMDAQIAGEREMT